MGSARDVLLYIMSFSWSLVQAVWVEPQQFWVQPPRFCVQPGAPCSQPCQLCQWLHLSCIGCARYSTPQSHGDSEARKHVERGTASEYACSSNLSWVL